TSSGEAASNSTVVSTTGDAALESAVRRAGRKKAAAQASLFDLANQRVVEEIRNADPDTLSPEEAKELLRKLRDRLL
ncbi:MAG: hypothetical protein M3539_12015, partial [Acidobacteriota bacterium]|nr:hypothetical protein [Acidobacteriota bacterium]